MSTTHKKILEYKPFKKKTYRSVCHCYDSFVDRKSLRLVVDSTNRIVYCEHCGNIVEPFIALELLVKDWEKIEKAENEIKDRLRRTWDICRKYRPWRRAMKYIEHEVGNGKARPICPHCHEPFALEEITDFRHQNKSGLEYTSHGHDVTNVGWCK